LKERRKGNTEPSEKTMYVDRRCAAGSRGKKTTRKGKSGFQGAMREKLLEILLHRPVDKRGLAVVGGKRKPTFRAIPQEGGREGKKKSPEKEGRF